MFGPLNLMDGMDSVFVQTLFRRLQLRFCPIAVGSADIGNAVFCDFREDWADLPASPSATNW